MSHLVEKARNGRSNALAGLAGGAGAGALARGAGARSRSSDRHENSVFNSVRAQRHGHLTLV